jgi:hypothetical protein
LGCGLRSRRGLLWRTGGVILGLFFLFGSILGWSSFTWEGLILGIFGWVGATVFVFFASRRFANRNAKPS